MERQDEAITPIIASTVPDFSSPVDAQSEAEGRFALPRSAYLHIPFCLTRCRYCDFAVTVGTASLIESYVDALLAEISFTPAGRPLETVYLGGGTPSLLSATQLERILEALLRRFGIAPEAEITLEANPGTFDAGKVADWQRLGINRISLGVQAFQPHLLAACGRSHGLGEIYEAVALFERAGFANFNLDLIFGLPEQTLADWRFSLSEVLRLTPAHLSLYDLILEENTPFGRRYAAGIAPLPEEDTTIEMYLLARAVLTEAGFEHYEISNFARPGRYSRHNHVYWFNQPYYGIGNGATGYVGGARVERPRILADYFKFARKGDFPIYPPISQTEELAETLLLGLRLLAGVEVAPLAQRFGEASVERLCAMLAPAIARGLLVREAGHLRLTVPDGLMLSNEVFSLLV